LTLSLHDALPIAEIALRVGPPAARPKLRRPPESLPAQGALSNPGAPPDDHRPIGPLSFCLSRGTVTRRSVPRPVVDFISRTFHPGRGAFLESRSGRDRVCRSRSHAGEIKANSVVQNRTDNGALR